MFFGYGGIGRLSGSGLPDAGSANASRRANSADTRAKEIGRDVRSLEERLDELSLACAAMWELLEEKTSLTHEDLFAKVREIDLRDGTADGKVTKTVKKCPDCGRTMSTRHKKCLYCGAIELKMTPFEGV
jgi:ribosomal protein S27AE